MITLVTIAKNTRHISATCTAKQKLPEAPTSERDTAPTALGSCMHVIQDDGKPYPLDSLVVLMKPTKVQVIHKPAAEPVRRPR